jgi:hypothetical protein
VGVVLCSHLVYEGKHSDTGKTLILKVAATDGNYAFGEPPFNQRLLFSLSFRRSLHEKYLQPFRGCFSVVHPRGVLNRGCGREGGPREDERPVARKPRVTQRPFSSET